MVQTNIAMKNSKPIYKMTYVAETTTYHNHSVKQYITVHFIIIKNALGIPVYQQLKKRTLHIVEDVL